MVVLATDGLYDNVFDYDIASIVGRCDWARIIALYSPMVLSVL